jgi:hypothetical protein
LPNDAPPRGQQLEAVGHVVANDRRLRGQLGVGLVCPFSSDPKEGLDVRLVFAGRGKGVGRAKAIDMHGDDERVAHVAVRPGRASPAAGLKQPRLAALTHLDRQKVLRPLRHSPLCFDLFREVELDLIRQRELARLFCPDLDEVEPFGRPRADAGFRAPHLGADELKRFAERGHEAFFQVLLRHGLFGRRFSSPERGEEQGHEDQD